MQNRIGQRLGVLLTALPPASAVEFAVKAEERGFGSVWFPEITFADAFGPATAAALRTEVIAVGTGIVGIWSRSAVTAALEAVTLNELSGGRLILGLGTQARGYVEEWHNQKYRSPVAAMREFVTIVKSICAGEVTNYAGRIFSVKNFQLMTDVSEPKVRIFIAANGPRMLQLAGEIADGVIGYFQSVEYVENVVVPNVKLGAERASRSVSDVKITVGLPAVVTSDDSGIDAAKGQVVMYASATESSPSYIDSIAAAGFADGAEEIRTRVAAGDVSGAFSVVSHEMADMLTLSGSPGHIWKRIEDYWKVGVDSIILTPTVPHGWYSLYEGHFPAGVEQPRFDYAAYLAVLERTLELPRNLQGSGPVD